MQACISHLHGLTSLEVAFIRTLFEPASLDNMLACLPALKVISLEFRWANELRLLPPPQDAFPCSMLR